MRLLMLGIAVAVAGLMPANGMANDQQIADYIKSRLQVEQQRGNLRGFNVDMRVERGTVWFNGHVANSEQEMLILKSAQQAGHLGVVQVVDDIEIQGASVADYQQSKPAQYQQMAFQQNSYSQPTPAYQSAGFPAQVGFQQSVAPPAPSQMDTRVAVASSMPMPFATAGAPSPAHGAPMSAGSMGAGGGMASGSPNMPGYSWPGYAASPNYAALSYPKQYSPAAWPYIGPFYPYPQVPLGWRRVQLEWDDGWWYLDFHDK